MNRSFCLATLLLLPFLSAAQQLRPASSAQIYHELNQLKHLTSVLYLAAHPDDENTRMIGWLVNEKHIPTAYLSLTRGDGGQNILGPHLGPALGLIRTHELLEARKLDGGAGQFFTRAVDFGYSKTAEETFNHWDKERLTADVTYVIRQFRPDVIICRFPPNEQAGHGQHAASAILGKLAFNAAGDADKYREQFKYVTPWQPKRILFNAYRFGDRNTTNDKQFKLEVGQYNPLLGMGYGELAGISRSIHRSQGAGTRSIPGVQTEYLELVDGAPIDSSLFDGIDITWNRIGRPDITKKIENIIAAYDFNHPEKSLPALLDLYKVVREVKDNDWKYRKMQELEQLILHAAGFMAEIYTDEPEVMRGETIPITMNFIARSGDVKIKLQDIQCLETDTVCHLFLPDDELVTFKRTMQVPAGTPYTQPYWLSQSQPDDAHYPIPDEQLLGLPRTPDILAAKMRILIGDETLLVDIPLSYKTLDATHGDMVEQLRVVPDAVVNFTSSFYLVKDDKTFSPVVHIHANRDLHDAVLKVYTPKMAKDISFSMRANTDTTIKVLFDGNLALAAYNEDPVLYAQVEDSAGHTFNRSQHTIKYEHLPTLQYYTIAHTTVLRKTWQSKAKRIAYIEGAGDNVKDVLEFAGLQVETLKDAEINAPNLKQYDAVLVGIRALNVNERSQVWMPELLRYVKNGGTLVMQYNTSSRLQTEDIGPYPFKLSRDRVTEENAAVEILAPEHSLLNTPNKITQADFDKWVQERGLYFADKWDEKYTPLFSMHDAGEDPLKGSTLYAPYGKGHYIYTSLSFFRQLPAGNTGAIRLLLNFLSAGK